MRLNEILIEQQLDEKPQGFLSRVKDRVKSFVPGTTGDKAKGNLEVGKEANWLKQKFNVHLGKIGKDATPQIVIDFLRKNNYPTGDAEKEMTKVSTGQKVGAAAGAAAKGAVDATKAAGKGVADVAKGAVAGAKDAVAGTDAKKPAATTQPPAQNTAQKPPAGNPDNNLQIKGAKKKIVPPSEQNKQAVNQSIDWSGAKFISEDAAVTLSDKQLDGIFMAAVRHAIARDEGGQADTGTGVAPDNAQQGGAKGVAQAATTAFKGTDVPPEIQKQIQSMRTADKQKLLKML